MAGAKVFVEVPGVVRSARSQDTWPDGNKMQYPRHSVVLRQGYQDVYIDCSAVQVKELAAQVGQEVSLNCLADIYIGKKGPGLSLQMADDK